MNVIKEIVNERELFQEIENNPELSQLKLSKKLNVSVGLVNLFIKRLTKKGFVKVKRINGKCLAYLLTPDGIKEKARLTKEYLEASISHYHRARIILKEEFRKLLNRKILKIAVYSSPEWAEISYLTANELGMEIKIFIVDDYENDSIFDIPVYSYNEETIKKIKYPVIGLGHMARKNNDKIKYIFETDFEGIN
ncbi:winged helix-turn-helix transcriptional regulator [Candidatus Dependentiae bacterium]|nr:winged helix-turn-helix transcriptional regulator [Candidatus Dependentiae bacterium]